MEKFNVKLGRNSLSQYISGVYAPSQDKLSVLGLALDVSEAWLMGYNVPMGRDIDVVPHSKGRLVPVVGSIAAGSPVLAVENIQGYDYADVPEGQEYYYLRVKGDSMINAHIFDGALVLVKAQDCAENGEIVVCLVNGDEATLKRFYRQKDTIVLQAENSAYLPIVVPISDFERGYAKVLGVAKEVKIQL